MIWVLVLAAVVAVAVMFFSRAQATPAPESRGAAVLHGVLPGDGDYETEVVGESHYQAALSSICGGKIADGHDVEIRADLVRDPHNAHDPNAVKVMIGGQQVGWLGRDLAASMARIMDGRGVTSVGCDALIGGGWRRGDDEGHFGVRLDLLDDEDED